MKVRIRKPHTHAGVDHTPGPEGIEIDVSQAEADFLHSAGICDAPVADRTDPIPGIVDTTRRSAPRRERSLAFDTPTSPEAASGNDLASEAPAETKRTST